MQKTILQPDTVAKPQGTYSQAVKVTGNTTIYIAGQTSVNPKGDIVGKGDMRAQLRQVHENLKAILESAGATFDNVVKTTAYVTNMEEYRKASDIRKEYLKGYYPPSTAVGISCLAREEFMVEVEAIAVI